MTTKQIIDIQRKDKFCKRIIYNLLAGKLPTGAPYYLEESVLKRYVTDNKQRFETLVLTKACAPLLLRLAHDEWDIMVLQEPICYSESYISGRA